MIRRRFLLFMLCLSVASATESRLSNISVRSKAGSDSETLIVGFAISGEGPKQIVLRGVGPSLLSYGVPTPLADPQLALFSGPTQIDKNDNWGGSEMLASAFRALGAFPLPSDSADAALVKSLGPGNYTAHLLSPAMTGIALIECYDADGSGSTSSLSNVSARSVAGTGADVLTVGFVITGDEPKTVLIRGVGPALSDYGVTGVLRWPELRLFDASGIPIGDNWGWMTDVTPRSLFEHVGAFALRIGSSDAVLFLALPAGTYSAQLSGIGNTTGTALIEVYAVDHSPVPFVTLQPVTAVSLGAPFDDGAGLQVGGADAQPRVISQSYPQYPYDLVHASIVGEVLVDFYIKTDGTAGNAVAIRATDVRFAEAALAAIRQWSFAPGKKNGRLVTTHVQQQIGFVLHD